MITKTKIRSRLRRKRNSETIASLFHSIKNSAWNGVAKILSGPTKLYSSINLEKINSKASAGDTIAIVGKVLSKGNLSKRIKVCALGASKEAMKKIKESKSEFILLLDEIKKNPKAEGVKFLR